MAFQSGFATGFADEVVVEEPAPPPTRGGGGKPIVWRWSRVEPWTALRPPVRVSVAIHGHYRISARVLTVAVSARWHLVSTASARLVTMTMTAAAYRRQTEHIEELEVLIALAAMGRP